VHGKRGISADTALRLSRALRLSDMFFMNVHAHYDAGVAREHISTELATIESDCVSPDAIFCQITWPPAIVTHSRR
jgi:plasmid maintenance system antidote protein VapI